MPAAADLLAAMNDLRRAADAPIIPSDARLEASARAHALYNSRNNVSGHYEVRGRSGYTGYVARERAAAVGFRETPNVTEVAASTRWGALYGVRFLWDAPYHRREMMHPNAYAAGWGQATGGPFGYQVVANLAKDFGLAGPEAVRSPAAGQRDIPAAWIDNEVPTPVPGGAYGAAYGYPIMVVFAGLPTVELRGASLRHEGTALAFYVSPRLYAPDYALIVPKAPLPLGTIEVRFDLTVSGRPVTEEWSFSTISGSRPVLVARQIAPGIRAAGAPPPRVRAITLDHTSVSLTP